MSQKIGIVGRYGTNDTYCQLNHLLDLIYDFCGQQWSDRQELGDAVRRLRVLGCHL